MTNALAWMHDPAEFDALVHEIFVEYGDEENTPRITEMVKHIDPGWKCVDPALGSEPAHACKFVTKLFEAPAFLLDRFTPTQINEGMRVLIDTGELGWFQYGIDKKQIPFQERLRCLQAVERVYRDVFAPMYGDQISALGDAQHGLPSYTCFMWWDIAGPSDKLMTDHLFDLFDRVLEIDSDECRASALHGVGEHEYKRPEKARAVVARFLKRNPKLRPELCAYAEKAARGTVQ